MVSKVVAAEMLNSKSHYVFFNYPHGLHGCGTPYFGRVIDMCRILSSYGDASMSCCRNSVGSDQLSIILRTSSTHYVMILIRVSLCLFAHVFPSSTKDEKDDA